MNCRLDTLFVRQYTPWLFIIVIMTCISTIYAMAFYYCNNDMYFKKKVPICELKLYCIMIRLAG